MPYATQADLVPLRLSTAELVQLTDDSASGKANPALVASALEEASGTVDSYVRSRYNTPLQTSDVVKARTLDIAVYLLFSRKRNAKIADVIRQRYDDALAFLAGVSKGTIQLDQPASAATPQSPSGGPAYSTRPSTFSDCNLLGFK